MQDSLGQTEMAPLRSGQASSAAVQGQRQRALRALLTHLDVPVLVLVAVPALLLGVPALGYLVGCAAWIAQRILARTDRRWIGRAREPRTQLGLNLFEAFGRIWLLAGAIVASGVIGGRADGLTAALAIFGAYSIAFVIKVFTGPPARAKGAAPARESSRERIQSSTAPGRAAR